MTEIINAVYEGHGLLRLEQELEDIPPQARLLVLVVPVSQSSDEASGFQALRRELQAFETRYSLKTADFYPRFMQGELGDNRDFIVWAGLQELLQRMTPPTTAA